MATRLPPVDIVIVGMGWTGGILAKELAQTGLKIVALERGAPRSTQNDFAVPLIRDELRYSQRHDLMMDVSADTYTIRNKPSETALPMRRLGSFLPGEVVGGQLLGPDPALARGRRCRQVHVRDVGLDDLLGLEDGGQRIEPLVGDLDDADIEGDPAVAAGLGVASGQGVEDSGLARSGKPDDGDLHQRIVAGISTRRSGRPR